MEGSAAEPTRDERVREIFRRHGLRCTRQREVLYGALESTKVHPTAEELCSMVREAEPGLSLATVYNTLEVFTERGLCRRLPSRTGNGPCRYDADVSPHAHISLPDGRILDVPEDIGARLLARVPPDVIAEIEAREGVRIRRIHLELHGETSAD